ncbi:kynureninase [Oceanicella actignis]|uniref:Kynureninase n=1 Tax=Oceanicella actignis TaxID=1189325 RepID=A0A1M7TCQ2_9RHOB|nr:kynureninase [Oceanicella actignis]SET55425.1 Kynureninase [Oceanicella actignis]SHN68437.1 Kynureninase [Oceanicella actignis]
MPSADPVLRKELFDLPEGLIYLNGNSLGPLPRHVPERLRRVVCDEWGKLLIRGWNLGCDGQGWVDLPARLGARIGRLIGAPEGAVVAGDSTTVNVVKALSAALELQRADSPGKLTVLSDSGNFPTDLYAAQELCRALGRGLRLKVVAPEEVADAIDDGVAALMLTEVDYRTGRRHDMAALTARAHQAGALAIWDLAHSAGAMPVDLAGADVDFAVGCGYKYLNGGPGAPAFIYAAPRLADRIAPAVAGWMGHAAPFAFEPAYRPAPGADRLRVGTPPILSMVALDAALDVWEGVDLAAVRARSLELSERFVARVEAACAGELELASPRDPNARGAQVSFRHPEGYAVMQALIAQGVIGDFRAPDLIRFGFAPLYLSAEEVDAAAAILARTLEARLWDDPRHRVRAKVT